MPFVKYEEYKICRCVMHRLVQLLFIVEVLKNPENVLVIMLNFGNRRGIMRKRA